MRFGRIAAAIPSDLGSRVPYRGDCSLGLSRRRVALQFSPLVSPVLDTQLLAAPLTFLAGRLFAGWLVSLRVSLISLV